MPGVVPHIFTLAVPGRHMDRHILVSHAIVLYLNTVASVQFHLRHNQFQDGLKVLAMGSIVATIWTLALLVSGWLSKASRQSKALLVPQKLLQAVVLAAFYLQIAVCAVELYLVYQFNQKLTPEFFFILFETNLNESREFLAMYGFGRMLLPAVLTALPLFLLPWLHRRSGFRFLRLATAGVYSLLNIGLVILGFLGFGYWHREFNPSIALFCGLQEYRRDLSGYRQISESLSAEPPDCRSGSVSPTGSRIIAVVLGESTSRHHMGIYGYHRDTTPRLSAMADRLNIFRNVISPHSHTNLMMKKLLTFKNNDNDGEWYAYPTLINCLRAAGYRTYWISNQESSGAWANVTSALANQADLQIFNSWRGTDSDMAVPYDRDLLDYLDQILQPGLHQNSFIVLHLMGNHVNYRDRYPPEFNRFGASTVPDASRTFLTDAKKQAISEYDNAVLMSDHIVAEVIERLEKQPLPACVVFLSDHGEEVYDQRNFCGHAESVGNRYMIDIPFIIWLSESFKALDPEHADPIGSRLDNPYMTDDFIHTILDLAGVESGWFEPERSIVNASFNPLRKRMYGDRDYDRDILADRSRYLITRNFNKIWAHRVNSIGKLREAAAVFAGVELDLVIEGSGDSVRFDVNHPPAGSIGLHLDEYLRQAAGFPELRFWFDIKNLTAGNAGAAWQKLEELIRRHDLDHRVIVESTDPAALAMLADFDQVKTSFYLPYLEEAAMNGESARQTARDLLQKARIAQADALSYPAFMHEFVTTNLYPDLQPVDLLTWLPDKRIDNAFDAPVIQGFADDDRIDTVLVGFPTEFDR